MAENKVQFNLKNVHYALLTETLSTSGVYSESWGTPKAVKGAVSIELTQDGEMSPFYADGYKYFVSQSNQGYSGSLEMARIPVDMLKDVWGMTASTSGVLIENANAVAKPFALLFQIDGDASEDLYAFYKCDAQRPNISSSTNEEGKEPQTQTLQLTISPLLSDGKVKGSTTEATTTAIRNGWFTTVQTA